MIQDKQVLGKHGWLYYLDGRLVSQKKYERRYPPPKAVTGEFFCPNDKSWPMVSKLSLACDPDDVQDRNEVMKANGLHGVTYRPDGACEISDESAYKRLRKFEGVFNRDGYYG